MVSNYERKNRMHGVIRDPKLKEKIKNLMMDEDLTFEELIKKYFEFPDDSDAFIYEFYAEFEKAVLRRHKNPKLKELMEAYYFNIIWAARDEIDISKLLYDVKSDIDCKTYKKRKQ